MTSRGAGISIADDELTRDEAFAAMVFYLSEEARHEQTLLMIRRCIAKIWNEYYFNREEILRARTLAKKYTTFDEKTAGEGE
jgi:hypothetical protein